MYQTTASNDEEDNYIIPIWRALLWSVLFAIIPIVGATGNFIVVWIVMTHKNMRTVTNLFIVNLAVADGLVAAFDVPAVSYEMIYSDWKFGRFYCKLNEALASMNICVSMLTLSLISIDRYIAIIYPFRRRLKKQKVVFIIVMIWGTSLVITAPNWIYATVGIQNITAVGRPTHWCSQLWPDHHIELFYRIGFMITTYFIPLICMTYTYSKMGCQLWGSKWIGEQSETHTKNWRSKKKVVKMMIIVVCTFALCWLPFQLLILLTSSGVVTKLPVYIREIYLVTFWFAMSNTMYNPIIYCWMNNKFRTGFKRALICCSIIKQTNDRHKVYFSNSTDNISSTDI